MHHIGLLPSSGLMNFHFTQFIFSTFILCLMHSFVALILQFSFYKDSVCTKSIWCWNSIRIGALKQSEVCVCVVMLMHLRQWIDLHSAAQWLHLRHCTFWLVASYVISLNSSPRLSRSRPQTKSGSDETHQTWSTGSDICAPRAEEPGNIPLLYTAEVLFV